MTSQRHGEVDKPTPPAQAGAPRIRQRPEDDTGAASQSTLLPTPGNTSLESPTSPNQRKLKPWELTPVHSQSDAESPDCFNSPFRTR